MDDDYCPGWCAAEHDDEGEPHASEWETIRLESGGEILSRTEAAGDSVAVGLAVHDDAGSSVVVRLTADELTELLVQLENENAGISDI